MDNNKAKIYTLVKNHFSLEKDSLKRFGELLENPYVDPVYKKILGDSLRKEFILTRDKYETIDEGWKNFKNRLSRVVARFDLNYKNFRTNKITINKNEVRLFKHFTDYYTDHKADLEYDVNIGGGATFDYRLKYLHSKICECQEQKIPKGDNLKIVLSMDFADWFLCSTAEDWSSCISLESHYDNVMWAGLPGLVGDPNRSMLYITDGKQKTYKEITVDRLISRSWTLIGKDEKIHVVRFYPHEHFNLETLKSLTGLDLYYIREGFRSKYKITPIYHNNDCSSFIYQDAASIDENHYLSYGGGGHFYIHKSRGRDILNGGVFNYDGGLSELIADKQQLSDAGGGACIECSACGHEMDPDDAFYYHDDPYCEYCYNEYYIECCKCGLTISQEDSAYFHDEYYCDRCRDRYLVQCYDCGKFIMKSDAEKYHKNDRQIFCNKCFTKKSGTDKTEEIFHNKKGHDKAG